MASGYNPRKSYAPPDELDVLGGSVDPLSAALDMLADKIEGLKGDEKAAFDDLEFYSRWVIGYNNPEYKSNSRVIRRIYQTLQEDADNNYLVIAPRGSAKSQAVTITYTTWMIGRNRLLRFLIACASMEAQGMAFARQIDTIFTQNERYINVFGQMKPDQPTKWDASEKIVARKEPPGGMKDPTLSVVGLGSAVPSKRADIVICDDLVTMENAYSAILRKKVIQYVFQTLFPILVPGGKRIIVGTLWHQEDIYHEAARRWGLEFPKVPVLDPRKMLEYARSAGYLDGTQYEDQITGSDPLTKGQDSDELHEQHSESTNIGLARG